MKFQVLNNLKLFQIYSVYPILTSFDPFMSNPKPKEAIHPAVPLPMVDAFYLTFSES
jgi:uncharacterized membrane protein (DUF485 family)